QAWKGPRKRQIRFTASPARHPCRDGRAVRRQTADLKIEGSIPSPCFPSGLRPVGRLPPSLAPRLPASRVRVLALVLLLLLPSVQAGGQLGDLIVQTREGALPPPGAIPLHVFPGYVLLAATPLEEAALRASRDVLRVDRAEPLSLDASAPARAARDHALRLTRADAESLAPFHADGSG